jgi:phosphoketolase
LSEQSANSGPLSPELLAKMDAYWRAANYLSVGQIYLKDNPLLDRPLTLDDVKPRLLDHWGTTPGLNFLYVHWNRLIRERGLNMLYIIGPGHGGPGLVANTYLEGSYSEIYPRASNDEGGPEVVMACCGDVPTMEALAAVSLLRNRVPDLRIRVVNVVDLMALQPTSEHPHGLPDEEFDQLFPVGVPIIFAFHGYPWVIHRLTYRRHSHDNLHVRGYKEGGTTTTPFDMCVLNNIDRFQLTLDAIKRVPRLKAQIGAAEQWHSEAIQRHKLYVSENGDDLPEVKNWRWPESQALANSANLLTRRLYNPAGTH